MAVVFFLSTFLGHAQTILNADNTPNNTYELINSVLAPGGTAIETPDQIPDGLHTAFGRHIAEVFDMGPVSSIGSPITYSISNLAVAAIVNNKIHIVAKGTSNITASAVGNGSYDPSTNVQQLIVQCSCVQ